jgi:hypothetical protein
VYDPTGERPASRTLTVLARIDPATQPSVLMGTAVRAARAVAGKETADGP